MIMACIHSFIHSLNLIVARTCALLKLTYLVSDLTFKVSIMQGDKSPTQSQSRFKGSWGHTGGVPDCLVVGKHPEGGGPDYSVLTSSTALKSCSKFIRFCVCVPRKAGTPLQKGPSLCYPWTLITQNSAWPMGLCIWCVFGR